MGYYIVSLKKEKTSERDKTQPNSNLRNFSLAMKVKVKVAQWCPTLCNPMDYTVHGILQAKILEWIASPFSGGSSQPRDQTGLPHCWWVLYQLSHKRIPRILELVAYPFSKGSSQPRNHTRVSCIVRGFFTN